MATSVEGRRRLPSHASSSSKKRPPLNEFDSLHDLLEQAGYKETRVFTPASIKVADVGQIEVSRYSNPVTEDEEEGEGQNRGRGAAADIHHQHVPQSIYPSAAWFTKSFWRAGGKSRQADETAKSSIDLSDDRRSLLNRKRSEPALSKKSRKAVQRGWMGMWDTNGPRKEDIKAVQSERSKTASTIVDIIVSDASSSNFHCKHNDDRQPRSAGDREIEDESKHCPSSKSLRHTSSTTNLWQGSLQHHRSYPARLRQQGKVLKTKESYDGARVVAGVGVGSTKAVSTELIFTTRPKERVSLRQAFEQAADFQPVKKHERGMTTTKKTMTNPKDEEEGQGLAWADSVSTLADSEGKAEVETLIEEEQVPNRQGALTGISLFSAAATPLLSRQVAVAMRNVDCLDFAGSLHQSISGSSSSSGCSNGDGAAPKPLRKMRSVDALELALARMDTRQQSFRAVSSKIYETIPESYSADSLTNEELASESATTKTTVMMMPDELVALSTASPESPQDPIRRSTTPRLVITSPTGLRSPQELVLEGREYEPRSFSPVVIQTSRPIANRMAGWKVNSTAQQSQDSSDETGRGGRAGEIEMSYSNLPNVPKRSSSKRRSRSIRTRDVLADDGQSKLPVPVVQAKAGKKRSSKSCHDLRGAGTAASSLIGQMGRLTGSEQIRALKRDVLERSSNTGSERYRRHSEDEAHRAAGSAAIPCSPLESDSDDPFSDFAALTKPASSNSSRRMQQQAQAPLERSISPVPFEPSRSRRPLSASRQDNSNNNNTSGDSSITTKPTGHGILSKKKSGVGIACLIEQENRKVVRRTYNDENEAPNSLLDSPTAQVVKTRRSRTNLRQR